MADDVTIPDSEEPGEQGVVPLPRVLPDYRRLFKNTVLPDYSAMLKNVVLPDYSAMMKNVVLPDYSAMLKNVVLPDYSAMMKNVVLPDYTALLAGLVVPAMTARLHQVVFDAAAAVRDVRTHGAAAMDISAVLTEVDAVERSLRVDLATMTGLLREAEPFADEPTTTVGADLTARWSNIDDADLVTLDDLYSVLREQLFVFDALKNLAQSSSLPTPFEVYNAVVNTLVLLATLAMLLKG